MINFLILAIAGGLVYAASCRIYNHTPTILKDLRDPKRFERYKLWDIAFDYTGIYFGICTSTAADGARSVFITSFQLHGENRSKRNFKKIGGSLNSSLSDKRIALSLDSMPPKDTNGIPSGAKFWIRAILPNTTDGQEGMKLEEFYNEFSDFSPEFSYDEKKYQRHFSEKEVRKYIDEYLDGICPKKRPVVTKKD